MPTDSEPEKAAAAVPVIDLSAFDDIQPQPTAEQLCIARKLRIACEQVGFFYITGHGCAPEIVNQMMEETCKFFDLSLSTKMELESNKNPLWRGYNSLERGAHSCTPQDKKAAKDLKESFTIGAEKDMGKSPMHGPNQWPPADQAPKMKETAQQCWNALKGPVATRLMQALALSLDQPMDFFVDKCQKSPHPQMVLLRHPPVSSSATTNAATGCGAHTDCGFLTILTQDQAGLEVQLPNSHTWISAPPILNEFVVNLGDMMAHWTNDRYRSTMHRVSNFSSTTTRHSIPFFWTVDYDTLIQPIPSCVEHRGGAVYPPTTSGEHILGKLGLMHLAGGNTKDIDKEEENEDYCSVEKKRKRQKQTRNRNGLPLKENDAII